MKHVQRDRKHIIGVWFAVAACLLTIAGAFCIGVAVGRMRGPSEYAQQPPSAQPDTKEKAAPEVTDPELIHVRDHLGTRVPGLLSHAERVMKMQRSARKTYHRWKRDPTIAPDAVALYADTLTWESPRKMVGNLCKELDFTMIDLYKLETDYRNLFRTDFFMGITIEERKRRKAMNSPTSQPAQEDVDNVPPCSNSTPN
jgi:hypothetical protein